MSTTRDNQNARDYLSTEQLAELLQVPLRTVYDWRTKGTGPRGVRIGKYVRYRRRDIEKWIDELAAKAAKD